MSSTAMLMYFITSVCIFAMFGLIVTFGVYNKRRKETARLPYHFYRHGEKEPKSKPSRGSMSTDRSVDGREPRSKSKDHRRHRKQQQTQPKISTEENAAVADAGAVAADGAAAVAAADGPPGVVAADDAAAQVAPEQPFEPKFDLSLPPLEPTTSEKSNKAALANAYLLKKFAMMHGAKYRAKKDTKNVPGSARVFANLTTSKPAKDSETPKETGP